MILVFVEHVDGAPTALSLEALTMGRRLTQETGSALEAVVIGPAGGSAAAMLGAYGVGVVHIANDAPLAECAPAAWAQSIVELVNRVHPAIVIGTGSDRGSEVIAHVAARLQLPLAANCTAILPGDPLVVTRQRWGGSLLEDARLKGATKLLTIAPHAIAAEAAANPNEIVSRPWTPAIDAKDYRVRLVPEVAADTGKISLAQARVVVGGGRGVGSAEGFAELEELAAALGGTVGCSRAVTSLGWRPHSDQVGQTGTRIAPDLYIACGISGAIQHMVGCRAAKHILAINTDANAPIVTQADYAVIGDVHKVLAAVNAQVRKLKAAPVA